MRWAPEDVAGGRDRAYRGGAGYLTRVTDETSPEDSASVEVTVVMPVFNGERHLRAALDSVLAQSLTSLRLIVVDDGSTDGTAAILRDVSDDRLEVLALAVNGGRRAAVAAGIDIVRTSFVAVIGADDVVLDGWLSESLSYFHAHPDIDVVSCQLRLTDEQGVPYGGHSGQPLDHASIAAGMLIRPTVNHGGSVCRVDAVRSVGYDAPFDVAEDYHLWARMLLAGCRFANLPDVLYLYRQHPGQSTRMESEEMFEAAGRVQAMLVDGIWPDASPDLRSKLLRWLRGDAAVSAGRVDLAQLVDDALIATRHIVQAPPDLLPAPGPAGLRRDVIAVNLVARGGTPSFAGLRDAWGELTWRQRLPVVRRMVMKTVRPTARA